MTHFPVLGIDLGTTNSVVAIAGSSRVRALEDAAGKRLVPSVVGFLPTGEIVVGERARERRRIDPGNTIYSVKRLVGRAFESAEVRRARTLYPYELREGPTGGVLVSVRHETYTPSEISGFILHEVRSLAERALASRCERAVITVPASFNELQRNATKAAGRIAGLEVVRILNEPTAAALAYGLGSQRRERVAVYDLGGGTFDLTILDLAGDVFEVLATSGDSYLGGDDLDRLVADRFAADLLTRRGIDASADPAVDERLRLAAEATKCRLSFEEHVEVRLPEIAYGVGGRAIDLESSLTRDELEAVIAPTLARTFDVCEEAMRLAALRPTQIDRVVLVGGSTRIPLVRRMVENYFGDKVLSHVDPDLVVAEGAAIQAHALSRSSADTTAAIGRVRLRRSTFEELGTEPRGTSVPADAPAEPTSPSLTAGVGSDVDSEPTVPRAEGIYHPPSPASIASRPSSLPPPVEPFGVARVATVPSRSRSDRGPGDGATDAPVDSARSVPPPTPGAPRVTTLAPTAAASHATARAPLLLDVTPLSLGIETTGGFCQAVIARNASVPTEETREFSTARDGQESVRVQICQGESRRVVENQRLGEIVLEGLESAAPRGTRIDVTFVLDEGGTLAVRAREAATGKERSVRIELFAGLGREEIGAMEARMQALRAHGRVSR